jgi:hypothetical protein
MAILITELMFLLVVNFCQFKQATTSKKIKIERNFSGQS